MANVVTTKQIPNTQNAPLISRSTIFRLEPLSNDDLAIVVDRALEAERANATADARAFGSPAIRPRDAAGADAAAPAARAPSVSWG